MSDAEFTPRVSRFVALKASELISSLASEAALASAQPEVLPNEINRLILPGLLAITSESENALTRHEGKLLIKECPENGGASPLRAALHDLIAVIATIPEGTSQKAATEIMAHPTTIESIAGLALSSMSQQTVRPGQHRYLGLSEDQRSLRIVKQPPAPLKHGCPIANMSSRNLITDLTTSVSTFAIPLMSNTQGDLYFPQY